jgi:hypothetical protein
VLATNPLHRFLALAPQEQHRPSIRVGKPGRRPKPLQARLRERPIVRRPKFFAKMVDEFGVLPGVGRIGHAGLAFGRPLGIDRL